MALFVLETETAMIGGLAIFVATLLWYFVLQARWFAHQLGISTVRACWIAGTAIAAGFAITGTIIVTVFG